MLIKKIRQFCRLGRIPAPAQHGDVLCPEHTRLYLHICCDMCVILSQSPAVPVMSYITSVTFKLSVAAYTNQ